MKPRLSIVTISYNQSKFLRKCLDSVIAQKNDLVEYIVVDPGSTDGSRDILREYAEDVDHLLLEPDDGPADGLNKGFSLASGEYGYFLNSDDFLLPNAVERLCGFWDSHPSADVTLCGGWMVDASGIPIRLMRPSKPSASALLDGRSIVVQQGFAFKLEAFRSVGGFEVANRSSWDLELIFDFVLSGKKFSIGNARIGAFRFYAESLSGGVEGKRHQERLAFDRNRMRTRLSHGERVYPIGIARIIKHLSNPTSLGDSLVARIAPSFAQRAWDRDHNSATKSYD